MGQAPAYAVMRVHADSYRIDRLTPPGPGAVAFVLRFRDRLGNPLGWRLRPLVVMQGARSRIHPTAAAAIASIVSGTAPVDLPTPRLSNAMT